MWNNTLHKLQYEQSAASLTLEKDNPWNCRDFGPYRFGCDNNNGFCEGQGIYSYIRALMNDQINNNIHNDYD